MKLHGARFDKKELISGATKSYDDALDEAAAFALRNTYPTYSKVPPVVQDLRKGLNWFRQHNAKAYMTLLD